MGTNMKKWVKDVLTESVQEKVVVYSDEFQPFHKGHYKVYKHLAEKFGAESVYIGITDDPATLTKPFTAKEKLRIIKDMYKIPESKIKLIKDKVVPSEIVNQFKKGTAFIRAVNEKERYDLPSRYYEQLQPDIILNGYEKNGYMYIPPQTEEILSDGQVRDDLISDSNNTRAVFEKHFGEWNEEIANEICGKLNAIQEKLEEFVKVLDLKSLLSESANVNVDNQGGDVDDGPGFLYGNFKTYQAVTKAHAERLGFEVVDYIMNPDSMQSMHTDYPYGSGRYPVSFFPSGVAGMRAPRYGGVGSKEIKGAPAYKEWVKHIKKVAQVVGYKLVDFLDADDAIEDTENAPSSRLPVAMQMSIDEATYKDLRSDAPNYLNIRAKSKKTTGSTFKGMRGKVAIFKTPSHTWDGVTYTQLVELSDLPDLIKKYKGKKTPIEIVRMAVKGNIRVHCTDPSWKYWGFQYKGTKEEYAAKPERRYPKERNPQLKGSVCKHLDNVLLTLPFVVTKIAKELSNKGMF